jgi:hypothetical protein
VKELVHEVVSHLQDRTQAVLAKAGCESNSAKELMLDFEAWENPFWSMDSHSQLKKDMERNHVLTKPVMIYDGVMWETNQNGNKNRVTRFRFPKHFVTFPLKTLSGLFCSMYKV